MRKKKVKLNKEQEEVFKNLETYTKTTINWVGDQDLREAATNGHIAVIYRRENPYAGYAKYWTFDYFDSIIMTDTIKNANEIAKYNTPTYGIIIDLRFFHVLKEIKNLWGVSFCFPDGLDEELL